MRSFLISGKNIIRCSFRRIIICLTQVIYITSTRIIRAYSAAYKPPVEDAEYEAKVKALSQMLTKTKEELDQVKELADSLKGVKLATPPSTNGGPGDSAAMKSALAAARAATEAHGPKSKEAALAWET